MAVELSFPSALSHFDSTELLDALSTGIVILDRQLCAVYANVAAQDLIGLSLNQARGRPFGDFLPDSCSLILSLRRALETGECLAEREFHLKSAANLRETRIVDVTITSLEGQVTGTHVLLEMADATQRQRITRENDLHV